MYVRTATNPEDASAFDAKVNLASQLGSNYVTYPVPFQLLSETSDPIHLFWRDIPEGASGTETLAFSKSTDGGATWAPQTVLFTPGSGIRSYRQIASNGLDRIDFAVTDHHPADGATSLYHFYYTGGSYYKSDGTLITSSPPLTVADLTLVYDGSTERCWVWDIAYNVSGNPVIAFPTFPSTSAHRYRRARWTGSAWDIKTIIDNAGGGINGGGEPYYSGGMALDPDNPDVVWASVGVGGGRWDIYRCGTSDGGATWTTEALTSSGKNVRPTAVQNHAPNLQVVWMVGTYSSYTSYNVGTWGAGAV
jgi:hypothetical protein